MKYDASRDPCYHRVKSRRHVVQAQGLFIPLYVCRALRDIKTAPIIIISVMNVDCARKTTGFIT